MCYKTLQMSVFSDNIRFLRVGRKYSQQAVADELHITRGRYAKYEDGANEPPMELLVKISKYYKISIDLLLTVDVRKYPLDKIVALPDNRIVLPVAVNAHGENTIEIIPHKATMGYLNGYSDPEYIESLQTLSLPFLRNGKYRAFPAGGDSMPPFRDGTFIIGKYLDGIEHLKSGRTYVFVTLNEGITYKRFQENRGQALLVRADNTSYEPYEIALANILEIWEFAGSIGTREYEADEFSGQTVRDMFLEIKHHIKTLKKDLTK